MGEEIKLIDESNKSDLVQKKILGCSEDPRVEQQNRDLVEIKKQLALIMKKLSDLETKKDSKEKSKDISNIKNCLSKLTKEKDEKEKEVKNKVETKKKREVKKKKKRDHIVVIVRKGDRLSDYAKRYYGDKRKYYRIYRANRDKIAEDFQLIVGDRIIIPLSPHYKYKKFKRVKHIPKKKKKVVKKQQQHHKAKKIKQKESLENIPVAETVPIEENSYPMAKIFTAPKKDKIEMLEEPVFVDDEKIDTSDFIPLDNN
jgi:hypothetical protein